MTPKLINEGFARRYNDLARIDVASEGGDFNISLFIGATRPTPIVIRLMERHPLGSWLFTPLNDMPWLVVVCTDPHDLSSRYDTETRRRACDTCKSAFPNS